MYLWSWGGEPEPLPELAGKKVWEFNPVPGDPNAFFAYPHAVVTVHGEVYPAPRPEQSSPSALSSGHLAWIVTGTQGGSGARVVILPRRQAARARVEVAAPKQPVFLPWSFDGQFLWLGTKSGALYRMTAPDFTSQGDVYAGAGGDDYEINLPAV